VPATSLDDIDKRLLRLVQTDASQPLHALGEQVGLSGPAVQRRLAKLRRSNVIAATVSLVNPTAIGLGLTMIAHLSCERDSLEATASLEASLAQLEEAKLVYRVTGDTDFIVILTLPDMERYDQITREVFSDANIRSYQTHVALTTVQDTHRLPI